MSAMGFESKFDYQWLDREMVGGKRMYIDGQGNHLPSVTTVLSMTLPPEKKSALEKWFRRVGSSEAKRIKDEAARVGSVMHATLEGYLGGTAVDVDEQDAGIIAQGTDMAAVIWREMEPRVDEVWGIEVPLNFPGRYAGVTDLVGVFDGKPAIVDFKQSNKVKDDYRVHDYYLQTTLYANAHNELFGTDIQTGHILMCTRDLQFLHFPLEGERFAKFWRKARSRVDLYHEGYRSFVDEDALEEEGR